MSVPLGLIEDLELERIMLAELERDSDDLWRRRRYVESRVKARLASDSRDRIGELESELESHNERTPA